MADLTPVQLAGLQELTAALNQRDGNRSPTSSFILDGVLRVGLGQGGLMGFGDEIAAFTRSLGGENYNDALADERARITNFERERPTTALIAELAGGVAPAIGGALLTGGASTAAGAARAASLAGRIGQGARAGARGGAMAGAVQGYGEGEGTTGARLDSALGGGIAGGIAGGVLGGALPVAGAAVRNFRATPEERAQDAVANAFRRDRVTPDEVMARYNESQAAGAKPEMIADVLPDRSNTAGLMRLAAQEPGADTGALDAAFAGRTDTQVTRLFDDFTARFGSPGRQYATMVALESSRIPAARELYQRAYALPDLDVHAVPGLHSVLMRVADPSVRDVVDFGRRATAMRYGPFEPATPLITYVPGNNGRQVPQIRQTIAVREIDAIKRGLDRVIERDTNDAGRLGSDGAAALAVKRDLIDIVDNAIVDPQSGQRVYRDARNTWAEMGEAQRAMDLGRRIFDLNDQRLAAQVRAMGDSEQENFLVGVVEGMRARLGSVSDRHDASKVFAMSPNSRDALRAALNAVTQDPAEQNRIVDGLLESARREAKMVRTQRFVMGGSQTFATTAARDDLGRGNGVLGSTMADMATGVPGVGLGMNLVQRGARKLGEVIGTRGNDARNAEIVRLLSGMDPAQVRAMRDALNARAAAVGADRPLGTVPLTGAIAGGRQAASEFSEPRRPVPPPYWRT